MSSSFYIDPDFRRNPKTSRYCCCCQKDIKGSALSVQTDSDGFNLVEHGGRPALLGKDCARKLRVPKRFVKSV